jgi:hypothetical protein
MASHLAVDGDWGAEGPAEDDVIVVLTGGWADTVTARGVDAAHFGIAIGAEAGVRGSPLAHRAEGVGANESESGRRVGGVEEDVLAVGTRGATGRVQRSARIGVDAADVG